MRWGDLCALRPSATSRSAARQPPGWRRATARTGCVWTPTRGGSWEPSIVSGTRRWLGSSLSEPLGVVAAVTSMHADGRLRQRATRVLAGQPGRVQAAGLAVRCVDHVPQVRAEALSGLLLHVEIEEADVVVSVLRAAGGRTAVQPALDAYGQQLLHHSDTIHALRASCDRTTRRWAFQTALDHDLLTHDEVMIAARHETDQLIRARCAERAGITSTPEELRRLLTGRFVDGRLAALQHLPDDHISDAQLHLVLLDPAARVRELAQCRARRSGLDPASLYRRNRPQRQPRFVRAWLSGLAAVGAQEDTHLVVPSLQQQSPSVRAAGVAALAALAPRRELLALLPPLLLDPSPRVAGAASRALARTGAGRALATAAWTSEQPWSRQAAWRLERAAGGWGRVEADLRAADDDDEHLSAHGHAGVHNWLAHSAATTWQRPTPGQWERLGLLLDRGALPVALRRQVAFHAGLP